MSTYRFIESSQCLVSQRIKHKCVVYSCSCARVREREGEERERASTRERARERYRRREKYIHTWTRAVVYGKSKTLRIFLLYRLYCTFSAYLQVREKEKEKE